MHRVERRGRAMGSNVHVIVWADGCADQLADLAIRRIELLEHCWSRFLPESELNRLNARAGHGPVAVSGDLGRLVATLIRAHSWSAGDVDATVLGAMVAMGYGEDFAVIAAMPETDTWVPVRSAGMADVSMRDGTVSLPTGTGLDPGAIGKGLAGDIVTEEITGAGAHAVLVSVGGDVVTAGTPPDVGAWRISVRDDRDSERPELDVIELRGEQRAVATSSTLRRRWAGRHHILDPRTGIPAISDVVQATVVSGSGWQAEAAATLALIRGRSCADWLAERGCTAYLLDGSTSHA